MEPSCVGFRSLPREGQIQLMYIYPVHVHIVGDHVTWKKNHQLGKEKESLDTSGLVLFRKPGHSKPVVKIQAKFRGQRGKWSVFT